jgi:hypothetical protein
MSSGGGGTGSAASVAWGIIIAIVVLWMANYLHDAAVAEPAQREADFKRRVMNGVEADQLYRENQWQKSKLNSCLDNPSRDNWACR